MIRFRLSALAAILFASSPVHAEPPHLDLVRGLRNAGMADLALEYLQRLEKNPPPGLAPLLPIEQAKIKVALAEQEGDDKKRLVAIHAARPAFDAFLKANPTHPLAPDVTLELAKLIAQQGKIQLSVARRQDGAAKADSVARARPLFREAADKLQLAATGIDAQLKKLASETSEDDQTARRLLTKAKYQAQLDSGINLLDQAETYGSKELKERAKIVDDAKKRFDELSKADETDSICWQARVWIGKCQQEQDSTSDARKTYEAVLAEKSPVAADAIRLATYLQLDILEKDLQVPAAQRAKQVEEVQRGCETWLRNYRTALNTYEGQGIRYLLATNLEGQARAGITPPKVKDGPPQITSSAREKLVKAERLLKDLADGENDFSFRARAQRTAILAILIAERGKDLSKLFNFEECYLAAQVEAYEVSQVKSDTAEAAKTRTEKTRRVVQALQRGLTLVAPTDPPRDVFDARAMLAYAFLASGDPYSAAILGEHLSRHSGTNPKGAEATFYALQAYARILTDSRTRAADADEVQADLARLKKLAQYMEATWPGEASTDTARHQLGMLFYDERNYAESFAVLARISPDYPALAQARFQQGIAAQQLQLKDNPQPAAAKKKVLVDAIAALDKVPPALAGASPDTALATAQARLQLATLIMFNSPDAKAYDRVAAIGAELVKSIAAQTFPDAEQKSQLQSEAARVQLAGVAGKALLFVRQDKTAEALKTLAPLLATIEKDLAKKPPESEKSWDANYRQAQRDVLLIVLRANIQEGKVDESKKAMATLQKATASDGQDTLNASLLRVVQELKADLDTLRSKNEHADRQNKLEKGLVSFLDELAKPSDLPVITRLFLAQGYASLDKHTEAASLLKALPTPTAGDTEAERQFRGARLMLAREYRLAKQYEPAKAVLVEAMGTAGKKGWGFDNLDVRKEAVLVLEDSENYKTAITMAAQMQQRLQNAMAGDASLRDRYYDFYFLEFRCQFKQARGAKDNKLRTEGYGRLAVRLVNLEKSQPDLGGAGMKEQYRELLELEPAFKAKYQTEGGKLLVQ